MQTDHQWFRYSFTFLIFQKYYKYLYVIIQVYVPGWDYIYKKNNLAFVFTVKLFRCEWKCNQFKIFLHFFSVKIFSLKVNLNVQ